jgi:hypothetical protein
VLLFELAHEYRRAGDRAATRAALEQGLAEDRKAERLDHRSIGISLRELAVEHRDAGDLPRARELLQEAIRELELAPNGGEHLRKAREILAALP